MQDINSIIIKTPMMKALHAAITQWTLCGYSGGVVYGYPRMGKSKAIRSLPKYITDRNGDPIAIEHVTIGERDVSTIHNVYYKIAISMKLTISKRATTDQLFKHTATHLADAAMTNQGKRIVLTIDEAQELRIRQLSAFSEIYNYLEDERNIKLSIFFIVNKSRFRSMAKRLLEEENTAIRERFFNYVYEFKGISNSDELKGCLRCYDEPHPEFSPDKALLYTYCPQAEAENFKVSTLASDFWKLWVREVGKPLNRRSWGMTYFMRTITVMFQDYFPRYWKNDPDTLNSIMLKSLQTADHKPSLENI